MSLHFFLAILAQGVLHPVSRSDGIDESGSSRISSTSCTATAFGEFRLRQRVAVEHLDLQLLQAERRVVQQFDFVPEEPFVADSPRFHKLLQRPPRRMRIEEDR